MKDYISKGLEKIEEIKIGLYGLMDEPVKILSEKETKASGIDGLMEVIKLSLVNYNGQISLKNGMTVQIKDLLDWKTITLDIYFKLCPLCEENANEEPYVLK
jgi:hypothetical protein